MTKKTTLILGVGNPFRRDDGIGPAVIARLQAEQMPDHVALLDGGTDGLNLLEYITPYQRALIIDAVEMGLAPGEIRLFSPEEVKVTIRSDALSTHGFGLAEVIGLMERLEIDTRLQILGIQAKDINFGEEMSPEIVSKFEAILEMIRELVGE